MVKATVDRIKRIMALAGDERRGVVKAKGGDGVNLYLNCNGCDYNVAEVRDDDYRAYYLAWAKKTSKTWPGYYKPQKGVPMRPLWLGGPKMALLVRPPTKGDGTIPTLYAPSKDVDRDIEAMCVEFAKICKSARSEALRTLRHARQNYQRTKQLSTEWP